MIVPVGGSVLDGLIAWEAHSAHTDWEGLRSVKRVVSPPLLVKSVIRFHSIDGDRCPRPARDSGGGGEADSPRGSRL